VKGGLAAARPRRHLLNCVVTERVIQKGDVHSGGERRTGRRDAIRFDNFDRNPRRRSRPPKQFLIRRRSRHKKDPK
jgi:hypothetical protein